MTRTKPVRATTVRLETPVAVYLDRETGCALDYARQYLVALPELTRQVEAAAADIRVQDEG